MHLAVLLHRTASTWFAPQRCRQRAAEQLIALLYTADATGEHAVAVVLLRLLNTDASLRAPFVHAVDNHDRPCVALLASLAGRRRPVGSFFRAVLPAAARLLVAPGATDHPHHARACVALVYHMANTTKTTRLRLGATPGLLATLVAMAGTSEHDTANVAVGAVALLAQLDANCVVLGAVAGIQALPHHCRFMSARLHDHLAWLPVGPQSGVAATWRKQCVELLASLRTMETQLAALVCDYGANDGNTPTV
jgi:hypothetical protein